MLNTSDNPVRLDSNSIVPGTLVITGLDTSDYSIDYINSLIVWKRNGLPQSVSATYRVFPYSLNGITRHYNYDSIRFNFATETPYVFRQNQSSQKIIDFGNINYNGSIGRGISFGNNQDAVVNSTLNLQLNGFIGDSLELTAAISDNNIPIQPEGNTQDLRDFDRIFIQVKKNRWQANFGDIDVRQSQNYFLNFYKRLQGGSFIADQRLGKHTENSLLLSGAIAKGKFNRNVITPIEGNQGPYRLSGANGELFFTILAGTERVFIDGQLMTRGEDQDYIINYNTAELTFTAKRLITKDSRIQAEFEYSDRNFLNSLLYANDEISFNKKLSLSLSAYSNVDAKNSSINQTLDPAQKRFLAAIGNDIENAKYPNAMPDTFSTATILYAKIDTVYNGVHDSIYLYSTSNTVQLYNLSFTNVGFQKGNYIPVNGTANGRVFMWVAPLNGVPQGDWEPVQLLVTPKKLQVISAAMKYQIKDNSFITTEVALSNYDVNTFSEKDQQENNGAAAKITFVNSNKVFKKVSENIALQTRGSYEFVDKRFKTIERLRNVEFNRDWGLPFELEPADQHLATVGSGLSDAKGNFLNYDFTAYLRSDNYEGYRHAIENSLDLKGWKLVDKLYFTTVSGALIEGNFSRPSFEISRKFPLLKNMTIGGGYTGEHNRQLDRIYDTLNNQSFSFDIWTAYLKTSEEKLNRWGITWFTRQNKLPSKKDLVTSDRSQNVSLIAELLKNEHHQFKFNATYRDLQVITPGLINQKSDESLLGRIEYGINEWKGFLTGNLLYEVGSGQEQKREYTYVEVPAGQGLYTWIDYNNDGIPQLNEFEIGIYQDQKRWIRIFTPTNQYVKANYVQFNYNIGLTPKSIINVAESGGLGKFVARFSTSSSLQIGKKDLADRFALFNPFENNLVDTTLILLNSSLVNTVYFNRTNTVWGLDITHRLNQNKSLLNYGFEGRKLRDVTMKGRWNITSSVTTALANRYIRNELNTPAFANRNYNIKEYYLEPSVSYIYRSDFRVSLLYSFDCRKNQIGGLEKAVNNSLTSEFRYNVKTNGTINGRFTLNNINYTGASGSSNSTVGYILLDGLQPGKNYLWNLELTKRVGASIEVNLQYEGRKPGDTRTIHTGRASVRAIL